LPPIWASASGPRSATPTDRLLAGYEWSPALLNQGPRSVVDLAAAELGMSTCSAHLQTLREAGLVETRRDGKRLP
jgi:DNA-binding transcriptional ArsR family regulator